MFDIRDAVYGCNRASAVIFTARDPIFPRLTCKQSTPACAPTEAPRKRTRGQRTQCSRHRREEQRQANSRIGILFD